MLNLKLNTFFFLFDYLNVYILIFNILVYLILLGNIFAIFFFFNTNKLINLMDLKILNTSNFFLLTIIFLFLSLAGIPPLVGFIGKFLMLILFFNQNYFLFISLFFLLNLFMIYFYIQNLRFLWRKIKLLNLTVFLSFSSFYLFNFSFINFFSFFFFENWLLILANLCFF